MIKHVRGAASGTVSRAWNNLKDRASHGIARAGVAVTMALTGAGRAEAQGWSTAVSNVSTLSQEVAQAVVWICFAAGLCAVGYAGWNLWKKGDDRHGSDVKMSHIIWPAVGGAVLMAISYFALLTVQTLGGSSANLHNTAF